MRRARERDGRGVRGWRSGCAVNVCAKASLLRRGRVSLALDIGRVFRSKPRGDWEVAGGWAGARRATRRLAASTTYGNPAESGSAPLAA
ncbi:MAG TPA: hypothetical protein VK421_14190 [Pyrinomonadaceae bacterium]|nr:hypothetical protein [Pyrinomonadaceae bacterium]